MSTRLRGRVGVVTGADGGIGRGVALALAAEGLHLTLLGRTGADVRELADRIAAQHGVPVLPFAVDVRDPAAVERVVAHVEQHLGPVDLLVTGPDAVGSSDLSSRAVPSREAGEPLAAVLRGPLLLCRAVLPSMVQRGHGHVVNVVDLAPAGTTADTAARAVHVPEDRAHRLLTAALVEPLSGTGVVLVDVLPGLLRPAGAHEPPPQGDPSGHRVARVAAVVVDVAAGRHDERSGRVLDAAVRTGG